MSAFICQISEQDWEVSKKIGLYGNREKKPDNSGDLRTVDKMSVIRDLIAIEPGDIVFFHIVKTAEGESRIHGIYQATSQAFYDEVRVWDNNNELFPYRFNFKPHQEFIDFVKRDSYIFVSELYKKIESKDIWSIATLENERNMERRAVRKISIADAQEITKLIIKHPRFRESSQIQYEPYCTPLNPVSLEKKIVKIKTIENSIKAFLLSELKKKSSFVEGLFGNVVDYMNETFVAQTTRKLFDLLVISSENTSGKDFYIIEAKTLNYTKDNLSQLLNYIDLFKLKNIFDTKSDKVIGKALTQKYSKSLMELVAALKYFHISENLDLLKYQQKNTENTASIEKVVIPTLKIDKELLSKTDCFSDFDEISLYGGNRFKIEHIREDDLEIKRIMFREDNTTNYGLLKDYVIYSEKILSCDALRSIFQRFNQHVCQKKNNDYSDCSLVLMFEKIEKTAYHIIEEYNALLKRPNIILNN